jgi:hypothetical protein
MTLLLRAILPPDAVACPDGAVCVASDKLLAVTSPHDGSQQLDRASMLAHHDLVAKLHAATEACLPARFPTLLHDAEAVRAWLEGKEPELHAALERVRGRSELAVTALWTEPPAPQPLPATTTPGRRYLLERQHAASERGRASTLADDIERALGESVVEAQRTLVPRAGTALSLALLVPKEQARALREQILNIGPGLGVRILVNGPWAAYSFVTLPVKEE